MEEAKVYMKLCEEEKKFSSKTEISAQNELLSLYRKIVISFSVLSSLCFFLLCWNIYLNHEIAYLHNDIKPLLLRCQSEENSYEEKDLPDELTYLNDLKDYSDYEKEDEISENEMEIESDYDEMSRDIPSRVKRSKHPKKHSKKKSKKSKKEKKISRMIRQHKGIGVHVEAKDLKSQSFNPGVPGPITVDIPGQKITQWRKPEGSTIFDLTDLEGNGHIIIPVTGLYFMYSQVIFTDSPNADMAAEIGVGKFGDTTFTKCLLAKQANPISPNQKWAACHTNGVKRLEKGQKIALTVHPPTVTVYMAHQYTYFGAFFLGL